MMTKSWLFRLYVLLSVGWVAWFAFQAYDANRQFVRASVYIQTVVYDLRARRPSAYNFADLVEWQDEQASRLNSAIKTMAGGLLIGTIAILSFGWARKRWKWPANRRERPIFEKRVEEIQQSRRMARFRPASTLLLVASIFVFPKLWLMDATAMANFWIARIRN
jgi:hypothetical protein